MQLTRRGAGRIVHVAIVWLAVAIVIEIAAVAHMYSSGYAADEHAGRDAVDAFGWVVLIGGFLDLLVSVWFVYYSISRHRAVAQSEHSAE
ncbi:MAG: hypothetical protein JWP75_2870 [Frondihabitans sp.]|nr:hypothetical protein [Frondihabitans sp.]